MAEVEVRRRRKQGTGGGRRRGIMHLPDDVLRLLLSFLPSRDAVQTCVLATRWRTLWKSVPSLRIYTDSYGSAQSSNRFVSNLLHHRQRTPLHVCEITTYDGDETYRYIDQWLQYAVSCKARVVRVRATDELYLPLPGETLISEHMTTLQLSWVDFGDRPLDLSSCQTLEVLEIQDCLLDLVGTFSRSLRRLKIKDSHHSTPTYCTCISAPGLVTLEIATCSNWTPVVESLPSLVTASIRSKDTFVCYYCCDDSSSEESDDQPDGRDECALLNGLSGATNLELISELPTIFTTGLHVLPVFSKLKTVLLNEWCVTPSFVGLIYFLEHSPILERLALRLQFYEDSEYDSEASESPDPRKESDIETGESYKPTKIFLASKHLKVVEIKYHARDKSIWQILKILITNGVPPWLINMERFPRPSIASILGRMK